MHLWSRLGNEKTHQFPEIVAALQRWARARKAPVVLDGEIVALDAKGEPAGFQKLQGRIHVSTWSRQSPRPSPVQRRPPAAGRSSPSTSCATATDIDYRDRPLHERRAALERLFARTNRRCCASASRCAATAARCTRRRWRSGWEGLIAKHADSRYKSGKRTPDWRKLKIVHEQEFVDRRLDRAAAHAVVFRRAAARRLRRWRSRLCRAHRHRLQ